MERETRQRPAVFNRHIEPGATLVAPEPPKFFYASSDQSSVGFNCFTRRPFLELHSPVHPLSQLTRRMWRDPRRSLPSGSRVRPRDGPSAGLALVRCKPICPNGAPLTKKTPTRWIMSSTELQPLTRAPSTASESTRNKNPPTPQPPTFAGEGQDSAQELDEDDHRSGKPSCTSSRRHQTDEGCPPNSRA